MTLIDTLRDKLENSSLAWKTCQIDEDSIEVSYDAKKDSWHVLLSILVTPVHVYLLKQAPKMEFEDERRNLRLLLAAIWRRLGRISQ